MMNLNSLLDKSQGNMNKQRNRMPGPKEILFEKEMTGMSQMPRAVG